MLEYINAYMNMSTYSQSKNFGRLSHEWPLEIYFAHYVT